MHSTTQQLFDTLLNKRPAASVTGVEWVVGHDWSFRFRRPKDNVKQQLVGGHFLVGVVGDPQLVVLDCCSPPGDVHSLDSIIGLAVKKSVFSVSKPAVATGGSPVAPAAGEPPAVTCLCRYRDCQVAQKSLLKSFRRPV